MIYTKAIKVDILKKVFTPESRGVSEINPETGINYQMNKNWIKQHESGIFNDVSSESCHRFMTPKEKY